MVAIKQALLCVCDCTNAMRMLKTAMLKGWKMFRSIIIQLRAAVALIAAENLKALRVLIKNIGESFTKSFHADRTQQ